MVSNIHSEFSTAQVDLGYCMAWGDPHVTR